jgi:integrase/recombinase XerD
MARNVIPKVLNTQVKLVYPEKRVTPHIFRHSFCYTTATKRSKYKDSAGITWPC